MQPLNRDSTGRSRLGRWGAGLTALALAAGAAGCNNLLDVTNPNNVVQSDLESPSAVNALVNGALSETAQSLGEVAVSTSDLSDETTHTGSQNWAAELDVGSITNPEGRSDALTNQLSTSRWLSDEAIRTAEQFAGQLTHPEDLARAYLYSGINYMTIADNFEDFTFSNRTDVSPPVGKDNMASVYDTAMSRLQNAEQAAQASGASEIAIAAEALQARTLWGQSMWHKLHPVGSPPADPWIDNAQANQIAQDVLSKVSDDWKYVFTYDNNAGNNPQGSWINSRQEFVVGPEYAAPDETGKRVDHVTLMDPIDNVPSPPLVNYINYFVKAFYYPDLTVVSAQELHLILAEAAYAQGDMATAVQHINAVRAVNGTSAYDPATSGVSVPDMIKYERKVTLFFQPTRRIWDMYRFGIRDPNWANGSDATHTGQMFIIGQTERISNCYILGTC